MSYVESLEHYTIQKNSLLLRVGHDAMKHLSGYIMMPTFKVARSTTKLEDIMRYKFVNSKSMRRPQQLVVRVQLILIRNRVGLPQSQ
jgi:hypothetical protein